MPKLFCFLLFIGPAFFSAAQTGVAEKMAAALDSFSFIRPQEKTYLQTDRTAYRAGESIWFKAYTLLNERPSVLSKVIYIDLVDPAGAVIEKNMLKLTGGSAHGVMDIKTGILSGVYYLRCYTMWMLNFPDFISTKKISIVSDQKAAPENSNPAPASVSMRFFPEGGSLVTGVKSLLAFKALNGQGQPVAVSGDIVNAKNEKVASFNSVHNGMGSFELLPGSDGPYKALAQTADGIKKEFPLPAAGDQGIVLSVDNSGAGKLFVKAGRGEKNKDRYNNLLLLAQMNYQLVYMGRFNMEEGLDAAAISKKNLPPGIMQVSILTEDGEPLAERLVFISNHNLQQALLQPGVINTDKRKKNVLTLDAAEFTGLQAAVSVSNAAVETEKYPPGIFSSFLLSSDIKGTVHEPGYYFKDKEPETLQHLDLLMMVNGWRRFNLKEIMANRFPPLHYPFETGLSITGKVLQSNGRSVLKDGKINLMIRGEDSTQVMAEAKTNESSVFVVNDFEFRKSAVVYYQGANAAKPEAVVSVKIDSAYYDTLSLVALNMEASSLAPASAYPEQFLTSPQNTDSTKGKTLREVVLRSKKRSATDSLNLMYASDIFFNSDQTLALNPNISYYDIWQFLRMNVPGIAINQTDTGMQVNFTRYQGIDMFSENASNSSVQFFLNEIPVSISLIESLDPSDVALVKIFKGNTGIALGADRGAIAVYTTKGKTGRDWRQKGFDFFRRSGYSVSREFYAMDHSTINPESLASDIRPTLYWNPGIKIINGKATIEFYNDDLCKKFKVMIEGMDKNGKLLHAEKEIE